MKNSKRALCIAAAFAAAITTVCAQMAVLSPALGVIESSIEMKKCGVINCDVKFSAKDFDDTLCSKVEYVTITSLPDSEDGRLVLDRVNVLENQTIARGDISGLCFVPAKDRECAASFCFEISLILHTPFEPYNIISSTLYINPHLLSYCLFIIHILSYFNKFCHRQNY